jgi:PKD repeat protein
MVIHKKKRVICTTIMLVLTTFIGMAANVNATGLPPVAEAGGPYFGYECDPAMDFDGSLSYDPEGIPLMFSWNIDGTWSEYTYGPEYDYTYFDDFSGVISLNVTDGDLEDIDTADVVILNKPPYLDSMYGPTAPVSIDEEVTIYVSFFDGAPDPRIGPASTDTFIATFDWGDDTPDNQIDLGVYEFSVNDSHIYTTEGFYNVTITIVDDDGGVLTASWYILVNYEDIPQLFAGPDHTLDEGSLLTSYGLFCMPEEGGDFSVSVDYGDESEPIPLSLEYISLEHRYLENGSYNLVVTVDKDGVLYISDEALITVLNVPPMINWMLGPPDVPIKIGDSIDLLAMFSDVGILDNQTALIDWGDEQTTMLEFGYNELGRYDVSESHIYASAGVYKITLTVTDDDGGSDSASLSYYVVVYDPNDGFVTGGGWIIAPPGSYPADPDLTGKATFGFVSKYKKGKTYPEGNTEFQFHAAGMNFHSHTYDWLIVAGSRAMYKGSGTINGEGNYTFLLTCLDGKKSGDADTFRIKIWYEDDNGDDVIVFDNGNDTPLEAGQITIHKA